MPKTQLQAPRPVDPDSRGTGAPAPSFFERRRCTDKAGYGSVHDAQAVVAKLKNQAAGRRRAGRETKKHVTGELRAYLCATCGLYHLGHARKDKWKPHKDRNQPREPRHNHEGNDE